MNSNFSLIVDQQKKFIYNFVPNLGLQAKNKLFISKFLTPNEFASKEEFFFKLNSESISSLEVCDRHTVLFSETGTT